MALMKCWNCSIEFDGLKNVQKFCPTCMATLSQREKFLITHKNNPDYNIRCKQCGKEFLKAHKKTKFCCKECATIYLKRTNGFNNNKTAKDDQLCWKCAKTDAIQCPLFAFPMRPNPNSNAEVTKRGYKVTECSDFEHIPKRTRKKYTYKPKTQHNV